jgi:hypothetical protein
MYHAKNVQPVLHTADDVERCRTEPRETPGGSGETHGAAIGV